MCSLLACEIFTEIHTCQNLPNHTLSTTQPTECQPYVNKNVFLKGSLTDQNSVLIFILLDFLKISGSFMVKHVSGGFTSLIMHLERAIMHLKAI